MEIKKSTKADLDGKCMQGFLLGVILVLTMLFVALEYDWTASSSDYDFDALENIVKELDLEALKEEERIPLIILIAQKLPELLPRISQYANNSDSRIVRYCKDETPLMTVVSNPELVQLLIEAGADVNAKTSKGETALSLAIKGGYTKSAKILRNAGAKE